MHREWGASWGHLRSEKSYGSESLQGSPSVVLIARGLVQLVHPCLKSCAQNCTSRLGDPRPFYSLGGILLARVTSTLGAICLLQALQRPRSIRPILLPPTHHPCTSLAMADVQSVIRAPLQIPRAIWPLQASPWDLKRCVDRRLLIRHGERHTQMAPGGGGGRRTGRIAQGPSALPERYKRPTCQLSVSLAMADRQSVICTPLQIPGSVGDPCYLEETRSRLAICRGQGCLHQLLAPALCM